MKHRRSFVQRLAASLATLILASSAHAQTAPLETGLHHYAVVDLERGIVVQRGQAGDNGIAFDQLILGARRPYRILLLQAATFRIAEQSLITPESGSTFRLGEFRLAPSRAGDADADGLPDDAEFILGTDPHLADTDGDNASDAAEVRNGQDPLSGIAARTGIIASVQTPGPALDVCAVNNLALLALGSSGLGIYNIFVGLEPVAIGLINTPGSAHRVVCSGTRAAVADGSAGLAIIDFADPPAAAIVHQVTLSADVSCVAAAGPLAFAGLANGDVAVVDLFSGESITRLQLPGPVVDIGILGSHLYALTATTFHTLRYAGGSLSLVSSVPTPANNPFLHKRLFLAQDLAFTVHGQGYNTLSLADRDHPVLTQARTTSAVGWEHLVLAHPTTAVAIVGPNPSPDPAQDVSLYDTTNPNGPARLIATFPTPGAARSVAVYNGLVYVADSASGLHVINFLPRDTARIPPSIRLLSPNANARVEENSLLTVFADASDDILVRNVEFYLDGRPIGTDGSYPFEATFQVPSLDRGRDFLTLQAIASDLGGNTSPSDTLTLTIASDATPPRFIRTTPAANSILQQASTLAAYFSEALDPASIDSNSVTLRDAGPDRAFGTLDDVLTTPSRLRFDPESLAIVLEVSPRLPPGRYRLITGTGLRDLRGNALVAAIPTDFAIYEPGVDGDADCLPDSLEALLGLDPTRPDSNNNGIPDGDEDFDRDALSNCGEVLVGTDPGRSDSDGNGIPDGEEDSDGDGITDGEEVVAGKDGVITNPLLEDSDGDGIADGAEIALGLNPLNPAERGRDVVVDGRSVALSGLVRLPSLTLRNGAVLSHPPHAGRQTAGLHLVVSNLVVDGSSRIDVSGQGYAGGLTAYNGGKQRGRTFGDAEGSARRAGGSHGGLGGPGTAENQIAPIHGDPLAPFALGGGGGCDSGTGGSGGGRFRVQTASLHLDGQILANGGNGVSFGGGGAGGSLWIETERLSGSGSMEARGGNGAPVHGGGGGGGRIAIQARESTGSIPNQWSVASGTGVSVGGPGSVFLQIGQDPGTLVMRGEGREAILPPLTHPGRVLIDGLRTAASVLNVGELVLTNGGVLTHAAATADVTSSLSITAETLLIASNAAIDLTGRGYLGSDGLANLVGNTPPGIPGSGRRTGGSHGGLGGRGDVEDNVGTIFGSYDSPTSPGGGGGSDSGLAGHGGGVLRLIAQRLVLDGLIVADGGPASTFGGAGAGGSLWITTPRLEGTGSIRANGGAPSSNSGAGGGGRIALEYAQAPESLIDSIAARSVDGTLAGGSGTVFLRRGNDTPVLRFRHPGRETTVPTGRPSEILVVEQNARVVGNAVEFGDISVASASLSARRITSPRVTVQAGGVLTHPAMVSTNPTSLFMDVGTLTIASNAAIHLTGRGYLGSDGLNNRVGNTPPGIPGSGRRTGGSHGGLGGRGDVEDNVGTIFGSYDSPTSPGGGGGSDSGPAGHGGGVLRLIAQRLVLDGLIVADGGPASTFGGAGAGGSLWITVPRLEGSGSIRANGGAPSSNSGAGGGGRIALEYSEAPEPLIDGIAARSVDGTLAGGSGTVFLRHGNDTPVLRFRHPGRETTVPTGRPSETLIVEQNARVVGNAVEFGDISVASASLSARRITSPRVTVLAGGVVTHPPMVSTNPTSLHLDVGTLTIVSNAAIDLTGRGYRGADGLNSRVGNTPPGIPGSGRRTGGSHGGLGGRGDVEDNVGTIFGSYDSPTSPGGGGGSDSGPAGHGGGVLRLIAQRVVLDGLIVADGGPASTFGGAGAGGSLWITTPRLEGSGSIRANGGAPSSNSGAGGGGRIAFEFSEAPQALVDGIAARSVDGTFAGGSGTVFLRRGNDTPVLRFRHPGRETTVPTGRPSETLIVEQNARVVGNAVEFGDILVDRGSLSATSVTTRSLQLRNGGLLTHPFSTESEVFTLTVDAGQLSVDATSRIDVSDRGYLGGRRAGNPTSPNGRTVDQATGSSGRVGGGHGGLGGLGNTGGTSNPIYGDPLNPVLPGSGGGSDSAPAGSGGGVVVMRATNLLLDGVLSADGGNGGSFGGGGSGGSLHLTLGAIQGAGSIRANGGLGGIQSGGGGGGRIFLRIPTFDSSLRPRITALGAAGIDLANPTSRGGDGSVHIETRSGSLR